jgi:hypothetical protein
LSDGLLRGQLILIIENDAAAVAEIEAALRGADADVIATDQARGAILAERPFLSAALLGTGRC